MEIIDNRNKTLLDDLTIEIKEGSKLSIAAACFSIYAYQALKEKLENIDELRFLFTAPTFTTDKTEKEKREFYIPRISREKCLYGTEFEIKLRNELTQKAVAKECAEWISNKVTFKSNVTNDSMMGFMNVDSLTYAPLSGFTTVDLGCDRGNYAYNMVQKLENPFSSQYLTLFDAIWNDSEKLKEVTDEVIDNITAAYNENGPEFIYFVMLYNIFNEFLDDISEDVLPNEATGFKESQIWNKLYSFQKDAALGIINKLETYNGCILADSVGLGKTFTALAVIKYYENRNKSVLVLCPKKLANNWNTYKDNYVNNPIAKDRLNYDVLYHTDLSRKRGYSNGIDLSRFVWGNYDLLVIDESHNFRNGIGTHSNTSENRYQHLMKKVIKAGVRTKVLMLSATPVNNRFYDLKNQLQLAYEGVPKLINDKLNTSNTIDDIFKNAQRAFNIWSKLPPEERTTKELLSRLSFDFFELLDKVTIARSRKHIQKYYNSNEIGEFPQRLKPISLRPKLTDLGDAVTYNEIYELLMKLNLHVYTPTAYVFPSKLYKYVDDDENINQRGRELGIRRLMSINLLKRLESSVYSFNLTLGRIAAFIKATIAEIDAYKSSRHEITSFEYDEGNDDFDDDDVNDDLFTTGKKVKIDLADIDYISWRRMLDADLKILNQLSEMVQDITPQHDSKLQCLYSLISQKITSPLNPGNKKILIFTAFADTATYLYNNVSKFVKDTFGLNAAIISGTDNGHTTLPKLPVDMNTVLTCFSPISKEKNLLMPDNSDEVDILVATDCISEGQNLQDCDYCVNYDIHWNPVRIIQRFGRIDRIGSKNKVIQLVNFWPDLTLDDYINLKGRVETRMKIVDMTSTGDDNLINEDEKIELEYRKIQLKRLQEEVVDLEEMSSGISIVDLGLNEFRLDLLDYIKHNQNMDKTPMGLHAVVPSTDDYPPGVIYILKNISDSVNINKQNRLHPFYMVYLADDGKVVTNHLEPKELLDCVRYLCRGKVEPDKELCRRFNRETKDGHNMQKYSSLLGSAIASIIDVSEESDIESLFSAGGTSMLSTNISGLDDFELICFIVIKEDRK